MLELLSDTWGLLVTVLGSAWDILRAGAELAVIDDPFWRGVEAALLCALLYRHRKGLIAAADRVPLLGGALAWVLGRADWAADWLEAQAARVWNVVRSQTWDRLIGLVESVDAKLRK